VSEKKSVIFETEWRECLRAHFTYVLRVVDHGTERTLVGVMRNAGFSDADLDDLRREVALEAAASVDAAADAAQPEAVLETAPLAEPSMPVPAVMPAPESAANAQAADDIPADDALSEEVLLPALAQPEAEATAALNDQPTPELIADKDTPTDEGTPPPDEYYAPDDSPRQLSMF
jgi:hypothetical protein